MKKLSLLLTFALLIGLLPAQSDTTEVQIIEFSDGLSKRRSWNVLPPDTGSYRKILMYHKLKCDPTLISNPTGSGCGEWDANANFYLYDHQNRDSVRYRQGLNFPDSIPFSNVGSYTWYQQSRVQRVFDSTITETLSAVGTDTLGLTHPLQTSLQSGRAQYMFTVGDLTTAGVVAGPVEKISLDISTLGSGLNDLTLRMKNSPLTSLTADTWEWHGLSTVYQLPTPISTTGLTTFELTTPFIWDGVSNLVVELLFTNGSTGTNYSVRGHNTGFSSAVYSTQDDGYLEFDGNDYVEFDSLTGLVMDSAITISFWAYGEAQNLPSNTTVINGVNVAGNRVFNVHLPWTNEQVYWDCGNTGNSYDRINLPTDSTAMYKGQWNHWAFTKDAATGEMVIWFNGIRWHSGSGNTRLLDAISSWRIGNTAQGGNNRYFGKVNELRLWNIALDSATIADWMYRDLNNSHPDYANLVAYYKFDAASGGMAIDELGTHAGALIGMPARRKVDGPGHLRNMMAASERPNITFYQGSYVTHLDTVTVTDSLPDEQSTLVTSHLDLDFNLVGLTDVVDDTLYGYPAGWRYTYDENLAVVDSVWHTPTQVYRNWYKQVEVVLQKYITPYGNNLDLGDGFLWVYDVTDYEPLLHDTLDLRGGDGRELIDWKFVFIDGTPPREVQDIQVLYPGTSSNYANIVNNPKTEVVVPSASAASYGLRFTVTGHLFSNTPNCAEFCQRTHYFNVDGTRVHDWILWKECSMNPLYPQGGTWIYDRTGWCPGAGAEVYTLDLTPHLTAGQPAEIVYSIDPDNYLIGNWDAEIHYMEFGQPNHSLDVELYDIISPNDWEFYGRVNPTCQSPKVIIRNSGGTNLTSCKINYMVRGGTLETYTWNGNLGFLDTAEVSLPIPDQTFWATSSPDRVFEVYVSDPNGSTDQYVDNDYAEATYELPPEYTEQVVITFQANSRGLENSYRVKDQYGNIILDRPQFAPGFLIRDTLNLPDGCYVFELDDSDDDGLYFFNNNDGSGFCRLSGVSTGNNLISFRSDFGRFIRHYFTMNASVGIEETFQPHFEVYPNPGTGLFHLQMAGVKSAVKLEVLDQVGHRIGQMEFAKGSTSGQIDLQDFPAGLYLLKFQTSDREVVKKVVKQ